MNSRPAVRVLIFDAYGTLFDPFSVAEECERAFPGRGEELSRVWRAKQLEYSWLRSLMGSLRRLSESDAGRSGVRLRAIAACCRWPETRRTVVANAELTKAFTHLLSVDAVRIYKPNPAAYQMALRKLTVPKDQAGFVSANFWDVCGAAAFGFRTFWINRTGAIPEKLGIQPTEVITSLTDLCSFAGEPSEK